METTTHALIHCAYARKTWALWLDYPLDVVTVELDMLDIAGQVFKKGTSRDLDIFFNNAFTQPILTPPAPQHKWTAPPLG